jgi:hypothetical protein
MPAFFKKEEKTLGPDSEANPLFSNTCAQQDVAHQNLVRMIILPADCRFKPRTL